MTRRLEGPGHGVASLDTSSSEARQVVARRGLATGRRRLHEVVRTRGRPQEANEASYPDFPDAGTFHSPRENGMSLDDLLLDFVMPSLSESAVLRRSVPLLQHCVAQMIPDLNGGEQLRSLAKMLMQDEIERHRNLIGRLQGGIET